MQCQASSHLWTPARNQNMALLFSLIHKAQTSRQLHYNCYSHNDVVDGDVNQFHKEANETHNTESYRSGNCNFLEFWNKKSTT
jgi:hypothetical protein